MPVCSEAVVDGKAFVDQSLGQLADVVADRVAARLEKLQPERADDWLDTRRVAEHLGIGRDSLSRLAAERAIPTEQAGVGCKLHFRQLDLEAWRCSGSAPVVGVRGVRHG